MTWPIVVDPLGRDAGMRGWPGELGATEGSGNGLEVVEWGNSGLEGIRVSRPILQLSRDTGRREYRPSQPHPKTRRILTKTTKPLKTTTSTPAALSPTLSAVYLNNFSERETKFYFAVNRKTDQYQTTVNIIGH